MSNDPIPPPYFITADDKRGLIVVTVAIVLAFVWVCSLIRIWLRFQSRDWKADDWSLSAATVVHTVQSGILLYTVDLGLGASQDGLELSQLQRLGRRGIATQILYVCTLFLTKCSVLFLYLRLSPGGKHKYASYGLIAASSIWLIMAIVLIVVPCNPVQFYTNPAQCTNRWPKWQAIGALDIVTEALIFSIAIQLVWSLQMRIKAKLVVVFAFSARVPLIAIAAVRLYYLHQRFGGNNDSFAYLVATQWQMGYAIMSFTITGMGPFLRPFNKEYTTSYHKRSAYGNSSQRSQGLDVSRDAPQSRQLERTSWQSEGYLMQAIPTRRTSGTSLSDTNEPSVASHPSATHVSTGSVSTIPDPQRGSPSSQAPIMLTADANFRPVDYATRSDTEIWVGDRTASFGTEEGMPQRSRDERGLVINKRTQFKIEVDRASRVV
ncbi:hypothetical protein FB567DRAFT_535587 [Paraphoma chrysanthemicola]|uniref:Rhodopsin domain-containing protein n=1 Tax=Paraphoma chrysanthemicola TaxID=798071 RepID=A0A8K0VUU6_9PLEO|nr:hypothetical protein FB567DRAFT_535587 [Paraphoma chrysanthemicola]